MRSLGSVVLAVLLLWPVAGQAQEVETGFLDRVVEFDGVTRPYQVYVPRDYAASRPWPVILFLHGGGEQGDDGLRPTSVGLGRAIRTDPERWPAVVVFPQVRTGNRWTGQDAQVALRALALTQAEFETDPERVYLTGLSRGGGGSWHLAYLDPTRFAAVLICCGRISARPEETASGVDPVIPGVEPFGGIGERLTDLPIWVWHGDADGVVSVEESRLAVGALRDQGAREIRYTELPEVGHNSWDAMYADTAVVRWLLSHRRPPR